MTVAGWAKFEKTFDCQTGDGRRMQLKMADRKGESLKEQTTEEVRFEFASPECQGRAQNLHQHAETEKGKSQNGEETPLRSTSQGHERSSKVGAV